MDNYHVVGDPNLAPPVPPTSVDASEVSYTNTTSGLSATNVQGALDEVVDISGNISSALVEHNEPTTTASQSYTKGEYLTQGGYFKKVTSAIASGESITGNNTRNTTVGTELTQINSDLAITTYSDMVSANPSVISFLSGTVKKVGHNYFMRGTFRIASGRSAGPLFKFNDFLAPGENTSQYIQVVRISTGENITNLVFPGSNSPGYNNGYIQSTSTLIADDYAFYGSWIE